jgi:hypothetical protein
VQQKKQADKVYRPSGEERDAAKAAMAEAKAQGVSFKDFYAELSKEMRQLKESTAYGWWQSAKLADKPKTKSAPNAATEDVNVSEHLATLLKKEGVLTDKFKQVRDELTAVQAEVSDLWAKREKQKAAIE